MNNSKAVSVYVGGAEDKDFPLISLQLAEPDDRLCFAKYMVDQEIGHSHQTFLYKRNELLPARGAVKSSLEELVPAPVKDHGLLAQELGDQHRQRIAVLSHV